MKISIRVALNGTDINPFHKLGLTQNPFPQTGKRGLDAACLRLQSLGGDPIPNTDYIRERLKGFSPEFIELCCKAFKKTEYVTFDVSFSVED